MSGWSQIAAVAAKERLELWRDGRLRLAVVVVAALLLLAALSGWREHRAFQQDVALSSSADREAWLDQGPRNPHSAAHFGQYAFRPSSILASIDDGVDPFIGNAIWMEAHYQDPARHRAAEDQVALARLGRPTAAFVLQTLLPLLAILLCFGAIAGEREQGTWRQALAQGIRARSLALGKLLGIGAVVAAPLAVAALVALFFTLKAGDALPGGGLRLAALILSYGLFLVGFLGLALAISAWSPNRRIALLSLLAVWVASSLVLPRLLADFSERLMPVPLPTAFWDQIREDQAKGIDGHNPRDARAQEFERKILAQYGVDKVEDLPVNFDGLAMQAGEEHGNEIFDKRWGEVWDAYQRQERLQSYFGLAVPVLALRGVSMAMAGTDLAHHRHFAQAAEAHRRVINRQLNEHFAQFAGKEGFSWKADPAFWQQVPSFEYRPPGFLEALRARFPELAILALWAFLGPWLACRAAGRAAV